MCDLKSLQFSHTLTVLTSSLLQLVRVYATQRKGHDFCPSLLELLTEILSAKEVVFCRVLLQ